MPAIKKAMESIAQSAPIPVIAVDRRGDIVLWNTAAEKTFGWKKEETIGKPNPIIPEDYRDEFERLVDKSLRGESEIDLITRRKCKDGKLITVSISTGPWKDAKGKIVGGIAQMLDISQREKAEKALQESEERYRTLFQSIRDAILVADTGRNIIRCNPAFTDIFGYSFDEIKGKKTLTVYENEKQFIELGKKIKKHYGKKPFLYTVNYKRKDGSVFPGETGVFYLKDSEGNITGFIGLIRDISDRLKAENALKESEARYRDFFNQDLTGDFLSTTDGKMIDCNPAFLKIMGYNSLEEIKKIPLFKFYKNPDDRKKLIERIKSDKQISTYELTLLKKDGTEIYVIENVVGVFDENGELTRLRGYIFDISDRKIAEERLRHVHSLLYGIRNVNQLIVTEKDMDRLCQRTCQILIESQRYTSVWTGLSNDLRKFEKIFSANENKYFQRFWQEISAGKIPVCLRRLSLKNPVFKSESMEGFCEPCHLVKEREGNGVIATLIHHQDKIYGVLYITKRNIELFTEEEESLLQEVAVDIGLAMYLQEESLKREEAEIRLQNVLDIVPDVFAIADEKGRYTYINPAGVRFFGKPLNEIIGKRPDEILPAEIIAHIIPVRQKVYQTKSSQQGDFHWQRNGKMYWYNFSFHPRLDADGNIQEVLSIARDITETKNFEQEIIKRKEELEESEQRFRSIAQSANDSIITADSHGTIIGWNPASEIIFGYTKKEALNQSLDIIIPPEYRDRHKVGLQRVVAGGERHIIGKTVELQGLHKEGNLIPIELSLAEWESAGNQFFTAIIRDITEGKKLKAQLFQSQKLEGIGQLAGGVAHDFNNILTVINGYSDLILSDLARTDPLFNDIWEIRHAGQRAASLTNQLLAFSRKQVLKPEIINLNNLLGNVEKMLRRLIGEDIILETFYDKKLAQIKADAGQVEQVIVNLAVNARDAMPTGGKLTIETWNVYLDREYTQHHQSAQIGHHVLLSISDNGMGMDKKTLNRIFEPFFTTKEPGKGTGLGLSTVYGIVKQSGGNIWVYSEPNKGTTFKIYFPAVEGEMKSAGENTEQPFSLKGTETILIVEDEEAVRTLIETTLQNYGYHLLTANDGLDALQKAKEHKDNIALLLTDVVMPNMSGKELYKKITALSPKIKVCYMSGYTDNAIVRHGILEEGVQLIQKPFSPNELARKVRQILDNA